jgi:hypothetical protein
VDIPAEVLADAPLKSSRFPLKCSRIPAEVLADTPLKFSRIPAEMLADIRSK